MRKNTKYILIALVVLILGVAIYMNVGHKDTVTAQIGVIEDAFETDGFLVWNEAPIESVGTGTLETLYSSGTRVAKGTHIATMHTGEIDRDTQKKLNEVNERIRELESQQSSVILFAEDATKIENTISERTREIMAATASGNYSKLHTLREDIDSLLNKKAMLVAGGENQETTLDSLYKQREQLESKLSNVKEDIYAPMAGTFSMNMDGYETILSPEEIPELTVERVKEIMKAESSVDAAVPCKIVDSYMWYFVTAIDEEEAKVLSEGDNVMLENFLTGNEPADARVHFLGDIEDGKCVLAIRSTYDINAAAGERHQTFRVIRHRYEGFKLPTKALRVVDGAQGVYIQKEGGPEFKPVDVLYKGTEYMIIAVNPKEGSSVTLYDEVIVD